MRDSVTAPGSQCRQNLTMKISRRCLADYVKTLHQKACRTCSTIIFPHSANQIFDLCVVVAVAVVVSLTPCGDFEEFLWRLGRISSAVVTITSLSFCLLRFGLNTNNGDRINDTDL